MIVLSQVEVNEVVLRVVEDDPAPRIHPPRRRLQVWQEGALIADVEVAWVEEALHRVPSLRDGPARGAWPPRGVRT